MQRAKPGEVRERFDSRKTGALLGLKRKLMRLAQDNLPAIKAADPETPGLYNRRADNWRPLFAIADVVGGAWPEKVKTVVVDLTDKIDESESAGVLLLADIRTIFDAKPHYTWFQSAEIIDELLKREDAPWQEWHKGKAITQAGMARLLKPFGIRPKQHRYEDGRAGLSSYERIKFDNAFSRYLPAEQSSTPLQPAVQSHSDDFQSSTECEAVELTKTLKPAPRKACRGVELRKPGNGERVWTKPTFEVIPNPPNGKQQAWSIRI